MRGLGGQCRWISPVECVVFLLVTALQFALVTSLLPPLSMISPTDACEEFASDTDGLAWNMADCVDVWSRWVDTIPRALHRGYEDRELLKDIASEMRQRGNPCMVQSGNAADGAGSSTIRHMATWIFAREIGCDWVTPDWRRHNRENPTGDKTAWYCHSKKDREETLEDSISGEEIQDIVRCYVISWLYFFHYDVPSFDIPGNATTKTVVTKPLYTVELSRAIDEGVKLGLDNISWDRLVLRFNPSIAGRYFVSIGSWDSFKRGIVRDVMQEMRKNFHESPRPWHNPNPACSYDAGRLDFAIHVRLGDRRLTQEAPDEYFSVLEALMDTITDSLLKRGLTPPVFHIFTETLQQCPSAETGIFHEMPGWPVELDQVPACLDAKTPTDCPQATYGWNCVPDRSGIFRVLNKPIVLHVGEDVMDALSCMTAADGIVMGCSAFGQIAGLLTNGISMFSVACEGARTPEQYKMIPPIAIAERGELWVPIEGSWRDPHLTSLDVFDTAVDQYLKTKG